MKPEETRSIIKSILTGKIMGRFFDNIERIAKALEAKSPDKTDRNDGRSDEDAAKIRAAARKKYQEEGSIEIDEIAQLSDSGKAGGDDGLYVQAWVWVSYADAGLDVKP